MSEGERQVFAMKLYDDWLEADMADSLEMYCYEQGKADALANKVNLIEDSNFNPQMLKSCTDTSYQCGYQQGKSDGAREFAEWICGKYSRMKQDSIGFEKFQNIHWKSIDEVLAEWQKEQSNAQNT